MHKQILSALRADASARVLAFAFGIPVALAGHNAQAGALPGHGHFVSGHGTIGKANQSLTVKQSSTTGIIDWNSFSIGMHNGVTFDNGSGATLNRVTGGDLSRIAGSLHATGSLYLMNSAGVIVSGTGRIVTGGNFVATTGNIGGTAFSDRRFKAGAGNVLNKGSITAGGGVSLVGHNVNDSGSIQASAVNLKATRNLSIDGAVTAQKAGGTGGTVTARARTIVIGADGAIDASGQKAGKISIVAHGTTNVAGSLQAEGASAGGFIETSGAHLRVADSARISTLAANGEAGTWLIDPHNFYIMPSGGDISGAVLSASLANNDVTISSSSGKLPGSGDIYDEDDISWSSSHKLTLDAVNGVHIDADISISGAGAIDLETGPDGYDFGLTATGFLGQIDFGAVNNGGSFTANGTSFTLLYSLNDLAAINTDSGLLGNYALATSLDGSSYSGWIPLGTDGASNTIGSGFAGTFTGLGHTVSNLTIDIGSANFAGLFGVSTGTIRDVGIVGGSVSGGNDTGALVGNETGNITEAYSTASVSGTTAGGLIGALSSGSLTDAYATGAVQGTNGGGGLVGDTSESSISDVFATGAVTGGSLAGGLAGTIQDTNISDAYATGAVVGTIAGGLVGVAAGGSLSQVYATGSLGGTNCTGAEGCLLGGVLGLRYPANAYSGTTQTQISNAYWDDQTTGTSAGGYDLSGVVGNAIASLPGSTTAQFQGSLPTGFDSSVWDTGSGLYPFLWTFFPNGAQAVSGTAYKDGGVTTAASGVSGPVTIDLDSGGTLLAQATTGANGYYYFALPAGTISNGSNIVVSTPTNASTGVVDAATLAASNYTTGTPALADIDLYGGYLSEVTNAAMLSSAPSLASMTTNADAAAGTDTTATGVISALNTPGYLTSASSFTIDQSNITSSFLARTGVDDPIDIASDVTIGGGASVALLTQGDLTISGGMTVENGATLALGALGTLTIAHAMTINDGGSLGLRADDVLNIDAPITAKGAASIAIDYNASEPANLTFGLTSTGFLGSLSFTDTSGNPVTTSQGGSLSINGVAYTLLYTMSDLAGINASDSTLQGNYALASSLDASSYSGWIPLGTDGAGTVLNGDITPQGYSGSFTGLGHTVSNLDIDTGANDLAGLFGDSTGTIRDIGVVGGSVHGADEVGGLVGSASGALSDDFATTSVNASGDYVGGLAGLAFGSISHAFASGPVTSSGDYVGGLAGLTAGTVIGDYATGPVSGGDFVGGLVGEEQSGSLADDYATGAVQGGSYVGGLVAEADVTVSDSYATGAVSGAGSAGGLVGALQGSIGDSYWDTETSGTATGVGTNSGSGAPTPLTTRQLQGLDPISGSTYFSLATNLDDASGTIWGGGAKGLYPYLSSFFPNGVQAVSGTVYEDIGVTTADSGVSGPVAVNLDSGGTLLGQATAGANGYYYFALPAGLVGNGSALVLSTRTDVATGAVNAATLVASNYTSGTPAQSANLYGGYLSDYTDAATLSAAPSLSSIMTDAGDAAGTDASATAVISALDAPAYVTSASSFTLDQTYSGNGLAVITGTGDPLTVADAVTIGDGGSLALVSGGALNIDAPITAEGATSVVLDYGGSDPANLSFGLTSTGFDGSLSFTDSAGNAVGSSQGGSLSINGTSYALLYSIGDLAGINTDGGLQDNYALATNVDDANAQWTPLGTDSTGEPLNSSAGFSGAFTGLGHTVANIDVSVGNYGGLFGYASGPISDVGVAGGSVLGGISDVGPSQGAHWIGGLVGYTASAVNDAFATDSVTTSFNLSDPQSSMGEGIGGLVGQTDGAISNSFATGAVEAYGVSSEVGGLVGSAGGTISNSYASGAIQGNTMVGGLAGYSAGAVTNSHATGAVSGFNVSGGISDMTFYAVDAGGLIGNAGGTVSGSYATGTVTGIEAVGGLLGVANAAVSDSFATGAVNGQDEIGGLVGTNFSAATISNSYATGSVIVAYSGGQQSTTLGGGLVGWAQGAVTDSYAAGTVYGLGSDKVGGLIGEADSTVSNVFSTGAVFASSGSTNVGGLVGYVSGAILTKAYWDSETTGQSTSAGGTPLTTAQMQSGSAVFSGNSWSGGTSGLFPYLTSFFPNGAQAISGFAYSDHGQTPLASGMTVYSVAALVDGSNVGIAATGANGYYYILVPAGTLSGTQNLLTYVEGGSSNTYVGDASGNTSADLYGDTLRMLTDASTASAMFSGLSSAMGGNSGSDFLYDGSQVIGGAELDIIASDSGGFAIDQAVTDTAGLVTIDTAGPLTESGTGTITADTLEGSSQGKALLNHVNRIGTLDGFTSKGVFKLIDASSLTTEGTVNSGSHELKLKTTGSGHSIVLDSLLEGGTVRFASAASLGEDSEGVIQAAKLVGASNGAVTLTGTSNVVARLVGFTASGNHDFDFTDDRALTVTGPVNVGTGTLTLTTLGTGKNLVIQGTLKGKTVNLVAGGAANESKTAAILASGVLNVTAETGIHLTSSANDIATLGTDTTVSGPNGVKL